MTNSIVLGENYFNYNWNNQIKTADGFILLKEMEVDEFLEHADDLLFTDGAQFSNQLLLCWCHTG